MKILKFIFFIIIIFFLIVSFWSKIYNNPYLCVLFIGKKGSGKTTLSAKISQIFIKNKWTVFSDTPIYGCYQLDKSWLGVYDFPEHSLLLVDEGGIAFDNRKYATFSDELRNFFVLQRHKKVYVIILSQSFNVDKKIRDLTDAIYVVVNYFNLFTVAKKVHKGIGLSQDADGCGNIAETYSWEMPFTWKFAFIPRWIHFFDSFICQKYEDVIKREHQFENPAEIERYRDWRYYKCKQIQWLINYVNQRTPRYIYLSNKEYKRLVGM